MYMKYNSNTWTTEFCFYDIQNVNVIKFCIGMSIQIDQTKKLNFQYTLKQDIFGNRKY